ncbi:o-succinylbenzoate--CoA ligase [Vibrio nitrifigilis]|uniref:O-succinylbenzoate--CoA ligase n=1 Tax=Vibrio nitrifigilis TaxID=2789781 RepID=A0ABS0GBH5_9VIBR|nr:o-succinylbenzoate--CoA ligase [Vibrio nitrifigilis]MBF8999648.1 o-succinylbenzoate--CoA ligase [Vibrio nitrifigilis]
MASGVSVAMTPWQQWCQQAPNRVALQSSEQTLTWQMLCDQVNQYASQLTAQGIRSGDVLTIVGKNHPSTLMIFLAAHQVGAICALTMPQPVAQLQPKLDTLYKAGQSAWVWLAPSAQVSREEIVALERDVSVIELVAKDKRDDPEDHYDINNLASLIFTSGSTGTPKAVAHNHQQHFASAQGLLEWFTFSEQDSWLLSLPMYHVSGLSIIYRWLAAGACLKLGNGDLLSDIHGVSHASLVPVQLKRLLDSRQPLTLTHVLLGGSHIPQELGMRAAQLGIETWLGYGMTEAASTVTARKVESGEGVGRIIPNRALEVRGERIFIGGQTLASGYYRQGYLVSITDDLGWFDSKDLGYWQGEELVVIGRADNLFISGGENIHCEEIEAVLNAHPHVQTAMVVPVKDDEYGHRPVAVLQGCETIDKASWDHWCQEKLEKFKWPIVYYVMPEVLTQTGIKVSRKALSQWVDEQRHTNS